MAKVKNGLGQKWPGQKKPGARVFRKARSPTFEEWPKAREGPSPTFGKGPENLSFLFSKI